MVSMYDKHIFYIIYEFSSHTTQEAKTREEKNEQKHHSMNCKRIKLSHDSVIEEKISFNELTWFCCCFVAIMMMTNVNFCSHDCRTVFLRNAFLRTKNVHLECRWRFIAAAFNSHHHMVREFFRFFYACMFMCVNKFSLLMCRTRKQKEDNNKNCAECTFL